MMQESWEHKPNATIIFFLNNIADLPKRAIKKLEVKEIKLKR